MQVEYLQGLIFTEFERVQRASVKQKLSRGLKTLSEDIIADIIPLKINVKMSVSTLYALETIFDLRYQPAQISWDKKEWLYSSLRRDRFEQLAKALEKKYKTAKTIKEKIEILERLVTIGMTIDSGHFSFSLEEAEKLKEQLNLTYAQRLRLDWLQDIDFEDASQIVTEILPQAKSSFELATLALISDFMTDQEREAVLNRYFKLFDASLSANDMAELGKLLVLTAYWNNDSIICHRITEAVTKVQNISGLSFPERRVNHIAASIFTQIDAISCKYDGLNYISA